jgi:hypothetical protein
MAIFPFHSSQFLVKTQATRSHNLPRWDCSSFGVSLTHWVPIELKAHSQMAPALYLLEQTNPKRRVYGMFVYWEGWRSDGRPILVLEGAWVRFLAEMSWLRVLWFSAVPPGKCRTVSRLGHNCFIRNHSSPPFKTVVSEKPTASYSNVQNENNFFLWVTLYVWKEWSRRFHLSYLTPPEMVKR